MGYSNVIGNLIVLIVLHRVLWGTSTHLCVERLQVARELLVDCLRCTNERTNEIRFSIHSDLT